jgi:alkylation response protein AidB-like acyl-CoA dehydrogenase
MGQYRAPLADMQFVMQHLAGLDQVTALPGNQEVTPELVEQILAEASTFASEVLDPLNQSGDREGARFEAGQVRMPRGWREAYQRYIAGDWNGVHSPSEYGGQQLPWLVTAPVMEMVKSANLAFSLCPMLTGSAVEALLLCGSDALKRDYLPRLVSGRWTGTMNLTEPGAGSDLGLVKTRAVPDGDHHKIFGQKIFVTYGEHDLSENIIHLVLARTPDAPPGVKGISLFLVPKLLPDASGAPGAHNDVRCASIEHKLGIHASPTAVLSYGEAGGAIGYLVGQENRGLEYMFIMMNVARFAVGLEGLALSERAYQRARDYARERVQSRELGSASDAPVPIIRHPDVRRMLLTMKASTEAMRGLAYVTAAAMDRAHGDPDPAARAQARAFVDLMIPVVKGWSTESAIAVASAGIQVHGGMGFIEETGAAQYLRDARITAIYEGTTGIQANDLVGRKIARDGGAAAQALLATIQRFEGELAEAGDPDLLAIGGALAAGVGALGDSVRWILDTYRGDPRAVHAGAVPFLELMGVVCGGWQLARAAHTARRLLAAGASPGAPDPTYLQAKIATARFFADHILVTARGLSARIIHGARSVMSLPDSAF